MTDELARRLRELDIEHAADLEGYVPFGPTLHERYRESHLLLHVSFTEGLPQVLLEAFAAGLPVVATDVGGIRRAVGEAAPLIPPWDAGAAVRALRRAAESQPLREGLIRAGHGFADPPQPLSPFLHSETEMGAAAQGDLECGNALTDDSSGSRHGRLLR